MKNDAAAPILDIKNETFQKIDPPLKAKILSQILAAEQIVIMLNYC
jgi:hypothetical protein